MSRKLFNEAKTTACAILSEYNKENTTGELERTERHSHVYLQVLSKKFSEESLGKSQFMFTVFRKHKEERITILEKRHKKEYK